MKIFGGAMLRIGYVTVLLGIFAFSSSAAAGVLDLLFGSSRPLMQAIDVSQKGVVLDTEFKVKESLYYLLDIEFIHKNKWMNDLQDILGSGRWEIGRVLPVKLRIEKTEKNRSIVIFDQEIESIGTSGNALESTYRNLDFVFLEKGKYHIVVQMLNDSPQFHGIAANFVVRKRPKTPSKVKKDYTFENNQRRDYAGKMFTKYPELLPEEHRVSILEGQVQIGMTPFEARLAGGAYYFQVIPDKTVWPEKYDPYQVMWMQSSHPDNSYIKMTFQNETQFPGEGITVFEVVFANGKVSSINKIK
jgi:hypothetical protein